MKPAVRTIAIACLLGLLGVAIPQACSDQGKTPAPATSATRPNTQTTSTEIDPHVVVLPHDYAALFSKLGPLKGSQMIVTPLGTGPRAGYQISFPKVPPEPSDPEPLTVWILPLGAPPPSHPTPLRELDRWNGHRVFMAGATGTRDDDWVIGNLKGSSGPLMASIVLEGGTLQFELKNRSDQPVKICGPVRGVPSIDEGWAVYEANYTPGFTGFDSAPTSYWRKLVVTLQPDEQIHFPVELPILAPSTNAKLDASYEVLSADPNFARDLVHCHRVELG